MRTTISDHSYVDRGNLDSEILRLSQRDGHIALKGESKSGKSWLRQKSFPDAIVVQCRIDHTIEKIYTDILRGLGVTRVSMGAIGRQDISFSASTDFAAGLIFKAAAKIGIDVRKVKKKHSLKLVEVQMICHLLWKSLRALERKWLLRTFIT